MTRVLVLVSETARSLLPVMELARAVGGEIVALSLSRPDDGAGLAAALAAGAGRAVALWDDLLAATDYYGLAQALAAGARTLGFDAIVCGEGARNVIGPAVAEHLAIPHLSSVLSLTRADDRLLVRRAGWGEALPFVAALPALVTVAALPPEASPPRPAAPRAIERLALADVGLSPGELRWRARFAPRPVAPAPRPPPLVFPAASDLVARLVADGLLEAAPDRADEP